VPEPVQLKIKITMDRGRIALRLPIAAHFRVEARTGQGRIHDEFHLSAGKESRRGANPDGGDCCRTRQCR
jgi:hypothetical protein